MKAPVLFIALLVCLCSCRKMAFQHTCTCSISRSMGSVHEDIGSINKKQIGTYKTAKDSCDKMQQENTYAIGGKDAAGFQSAICEIE